MTSNVLLFASSMLHITTASSVYNVRSDDNITISLNDTESGESLEYYLMNTSKYFSCNSRFHFKMGHHYLNTDRTSFWSHLPACMLLLIGLVLFYAPGVFV